MVRYNEITIQLTIRQKQWEPRACFPETRWSHLGVMGSVLCSYETLMTPQISQEAEFRQQHQRQGAAVNSAEVSLTLQSPVSCREAWFLTGHRPKSVYGSGVGPLLWRRQWQPTPVFLPGKLHGQRSLVGYSLWGCKELDPCSKGT